MKNFRAYVTKNYTQTNPYFKSQAHSTCRVLCKRSMMTDDP